MHRLDEMSNVWYKGITIQINEHELCIMRDNKRKGDGKFILYGIWDEYVSEWMKRDNQKSSIS